jgi:biofilm PGA synthesis N-glycosyltransferase PgaC
VHEGAPLPGASRLTILVPAYNEAESIAETIRSLQSQTLAPEEIIVIDDCSTDESGRIAEELGATVMRPPQNTGTKAGAQNFGLLSVKTEFVMAVDADTTLAPDAVERILPAMREQNVAAACGMVVPRHVKSVWERGRYVEYLFAFCFYKQVQDYYGRPLISSGCFSVYRTDVLRRQGGWSTRTMAEDMDLTWSFYEAGYGVRFMPEAVCYPIEPNNYNFLSRQLRRWSHGFIQNLRLHWRAVLHQPVLRAIVAVSLWDAVIASMVYLLVLPVLAVLINPVFLLLYLIDVPAVAVPVIYEGARRKELRRSLWSLPSFFVLRFVNAVFLLKAAYKELVRGQPLLVYEKGH